MSQRYAIVRFLVLLACSAASDGCASRVSASTVAYAASAVDAAGSLREPAIVAVNENLQVLQAWPLGTGAHPHPVQIAGLKLNRAGGIAANGRRIAATNGNEITVFDLATKNTMNFADPYGIPLDLAIGKTGALYVTNYFGKTGNVVVYARGTKPLVLTCALAQNPDYIAVDNEGDIFLNQTGTFSGVVEIPAGPNGPDPKHCAALKLRPGVSGYAAGVAIDPKTDDLLVLDNPDQCAGGIEGRLTTYTKPYLRSAGRSLDLGRTCAFLLRLDATSSIVMTGDTSVDESVSFISANRYPSGAAFGAYGGGNPGGFTTLPNSLPN